MFVRQKKNKSGVISVQVIDKSSGKYKLRKTIGSSAEATIIDQLVKEGELWINNYTGINEIDFAQEDKFWAHFKLSHE